MKIEKLVQWLLSEPAQMRFEEVEKILKHEGWHLDRIKGSHHIFVKGALTIVLPVHKGIVKREYLRREIITKLDLEEKYGKK